MGPKEFKDMMNYLTRPRMADGGRAGFRKGTPIEEYSSEVQQRIKDYGIEKYNKLNKNQKYDIRNPKRLNKTFNFKFKGQKFPTQVLGLKDSSAKNIQDLLNIIEKNPNITPEQWFAKTSKVKGASSGLDQLSRDLLKYIKGDFDAIKGATSKETFDKLNIKNLIKDEIPNLNTISGKAFRQSVGSAARAKKAVTNTFEAVMRLNEEFKLDPDVDIEELAEQLYGKGASRSVPLMNQTRNDVAKYVEVLKTGTRRNLNIPNFKYPSPDKAADILDSIADRSGNFGFQEGVIRDLKFSIRDDLLKLKKGTTTNLRRVLSDLIKGKGDVIDEAVGLSATFEDAPGYTEATQVIKNKLNKQKANTIDKPFSALIKKIKNNSATTKEINDFNTISKRFMKETGVDSPIIKTGKNLNPEKFVKSFKDYSPEAQANIRELAKKNNFVIQTKSEPLKNVVSSFKPQVSTTGGQKLFQKVPGITDLFEVAKTIPGDVAKKSYLKAGFKTLGIAATPLVIFDTYKAFEQGKPVLEALEQGFLGTNLIGGTKDILSLNPEERMARSVVKQDALKNLNLDMPMGFGFIEGPTPQTNMTLPEAQQKMDAGIQRVQQERAQRESEVAANRVNFFGDLRDRAFGIGQDYQLELAGGGIAKLAGIDKGPQRVSMNPDSQGLQGLMKRVKRI